VYWSDLSKASGSTLEGRSGESSRYKGWDRSEDSNEGSMQEGLKCPDMMTGDGESGRRVIDV
jgi:hypothetical protein